MKSRKRPHILVVEDQINWRRLYKLWLNDSCHLTFSTSPSEALQRINEERFDLIITDLGLPEPEAGLRMLQDIISLNIDCEIIVVTSFIERNLHLQVQKLGVYAVFRKDEHLESELPVFVRKAHEMNALQRENGYLLRQMKKKAKEQQLLGVSDYTVNLRERAENVGQTDVPVLITGPTGVGKTFLAKYIHYKSLRSNKPFISINSANLTPTLVESELFGNVRGAFTGADSPKRGKFELAHKGSILLDEIGEIPVNIQAKLLQVIEDKNYYPLGSQVKKEVDVRVIASTNRDLQKEMQQGNFREDLYYRLAGISIHVAPLAERRDDIQVYFDHFLEQICQEENIAVPSIDPPVYKAIRDYSWPGNVRELKNVVTRLLLFRPEKISSDDIFVHTAGSQNSIIDQAIEKQYDLKEIAALYARELLNRLESKKKVAEILRVDPKTLKRYLEMKVD